MKLNDIIEAVHGEWLVCCDNECEINYGFSSDLMSDALALIQQYSEETVLITGLCNSQSIRTADMLDIHTILIVRGKKYNEEEIALAKEMKINVMTTPLTMFERIKECLKRHILSCVKIMRMPARYQRMSKAC